jgi:hypothetical protein
MKLTGIKLNPECAIANTFKRCGRAVPAVPHVPQRTRTTDGGAHKKKGRLRCHERPKSREETPKEGSDSGCRGGVATAYP